MRIIGPKITSNRAALVLVLVGAALSLLTACGDEFTACEASRTCAAADAGASAGAGAIGASEANPTNGPSGGSGALGGSGGSPAVPGDGSAGAKEASLVDPGSTCGDSIVQVSLGETCDDGNEVDTDECPSTCHAASCGDGFVHAGVEGCDDGAADDADDCSSTCEIATCGDGLVHAGVDACDDANDVETDACLGTCAVATCGDGFVWQDQEACDPGATPDCRAADCRWIWDISKYGCALQRVTGDVKCWGDSLNGRLGYGDAEIRGDEPGEMGANLPVVDLGMGRAAVALAAGQHHTCAILDNGDVKCWGLNDHGQLGQGDVLTRGGNPGTVGAYLQSVDLGTSGFQPVSLATGRYHTCALFAHGQIKCWGTGFTLGRDSIDDRGDGAGEMGDALGFIAFGTDLTPATAIAAGWNTTCARFVNGAVKCWGGNGSGECGIGNKELQGGTPGQMAALPYVDLGSGVTVNSLSAGAAHICALLGNGSVKCWGNNQYAQLGLGDKNSRGDDAGEMGGALPAVDLGTGERATTVATGFRHSCALLERGAIKCWGDNSRGELGLGIAEPSVGGVPGEMGDALPEVDLGGKAAVAVVAHLRSTCARLEDGSLRCWGANASTPYVGTLGLGDTSDRGQNADDMGSNLPPVELD
jgi:cysteine-rich repeat protein